MQKTPKIGGIIYVKDYGRINIKLAEILQKRQISRNYLARAINVRFEVVDKWYNNKVEKLDLDILARVCSVLECDVTDVIEYVEGEEGAMRETLFNS